MQPEYQFAFEDVLYEEIPSPLLQHADAMYEGEDYDPRYYCQMTEVEIEACGLDIRDDLSIEYICRVG